MSRNYMRVTIRNESSATSRLRHDSTSGEWTPGGWHPSQLPQTPPGAGLQWQAEKRIGTEDQSNRMTWRTSSRDLLEFWR